MTTELTQWCELVAMLRDQGASIRSIARLFGMTAQRCINS